MKNNILDLLHREPISLLQNPQDTLNLLISMQSILSLTLSAVQNFINCDYKKYDALIGDNLCQIRAHMTWRTFSTRDSSSLKLFENKINQITDLKDSLSDYISTLNQKNSHEYKELVKFNGKITISDFLEKKNIKIDFTDDMKTIIYLYILTKYTLQNTFEIHAGIDYKKMCEELRCSKTFARNIVHKYQKEVSKISSSFIHMLCSDSNDPRLRIAASTLARVDDDGRHLIPSFVVTKVLLENMIKLRSKIIFKIYFNTAYESNNYITLTFSRKNNNYVYHSNENEIESYQPYIIFSGSTQYKSDNKDKLLNAINNIGINQVILGNMARHPQYSGKKLVSLKDNPFIELPEMSKNDYHLLSDLEKEMFHMKDLTLQWGCCQENPSLFLISHIYCGQLSKDPVYLSNIGELELNLLEKVA